MRKTVYFLLFIAAVFIVISCGGKDEKERITINPGLYEVNLDVKYGGQLIILKQRMRYKYDGTYEATSFQNDAAVEELRGNYKIANNQIVYSNSERRLITQDGTWGKVDMLNVDVRKIKNDKYEYFFTFPSEQLREQYKGLGLSEGWKTYKRISD